MNESLKKEIISWNNRFPLDRWFRQKHNIAFNSPDHRKSSFLDQLFEYQEEQIFEEHEMSKKYVPNQGTWLKKQERSDLERIESIQEEARRELDGLPNEF